jgi:hypothetical protein
MVVVRQPVDDGHVRLAREAHHGLVFERAGFDDVDHAFQHVGGVAQRFALPEMDLARFEVQGVPAELGHRDLERNAGARRGLLEQHAE